MEPKTSAASRIPDPEPSLPPNEKDDLSGYPHRQFIGWTSLGLAPLILAFAGWRTTTGLPPWPPLPSLSAYYYTGAVAIFVGLLFALAALLFTYQGYRNEKHLVERIVSTIAGGAAILVAVFPTAVPLGLVASSWWAPWIGVIHYGSAGVLMIASTVICFYFFRKVGKGRVPDRDKRIRNAIYGICSTGMVLSLLWAASTWFTGSGLFGPEVTALLFFAVPWLVKGRVEKTPQALGRWAVHFVRHPSKIPVKIQDALAPPPEASEQRGTQ